MNKKFISLKSAYVLLDQRNIDTDQILPARFMSTTSSDGLGNACFYDVRYDEIGIKHDRHVLNNISTERCKILVAGDNFGCGSSREHAVWALKDFGFEAILTPKAADIFKANALNNGLLVVEITVDHLELLKSAGGAEISIDLDKQELVLPGGEVYKFFIDPFARRCLLSGIDRLGYLLQAMPEVHSFESARSIGY